jgi:tetratricopeptide (TPR) repeat protein
MTTSASSGPFSFRDLRSLYPAVTDKHLRYLEKWGLIRASALPRDQREYTFADIATIKQLATELDRDVPLRVILRGLAALHQGQLKLDFQERPASLDAPRPKVVALEARKAQRATQGPAVIPDPGSAEGLRYSKDPSLQFPFSDPQSALAAKYFVEGSRLDDGDKDQVEAAAAAYRKALVIDPDLVPAIVNLANIHYGRDELIEAQALYERAISLEFDCFEAHFNLGNILHDIGRYEEALVCYREAVALSPDYSDAHFYLAVTLEKTGHSVEAKPHWKAYQELDPQGEWVDLAREFTE